MAPRRMRSLPHLAAAVLIAGLMAGCAPIVEQHGYTPLPSELAAIQPGVDTRATVARKIGRPSSTGIFTDQGWYYTSSKIERVTYHAPEVTERRVVAVLFNPEGVVADIKEYGLEDGRVIDLATQTTPTHGRELTIIEQAIGNIGVVTGSIFDEDDGGSYGGYNDSYN